MSGYTDEAHSDAVEMVKEFIDEVVNQLVCDGKASNDLFNDYVHGDSYHHEMHVDIWYSLADACDVIKELSDHEETDSGLWEGQDMKTALSSCAAFTYGNAVMAQWNEVIDEINSDATLEQMLEDYNKASEDDWEPATDQEKEHAFLNEIEDDPSDDGVKSIYADWLEEQGEKERADEIRSHILAPNLDDIKDYVRELIH